MPAIERIQLSASTNGLQILATAAGVLIHTATNVADTLDEIHIYAHNNDTVERTLVVEIGGSTADKVRKIILPPQGPGYWVSRGDLVLDGAQTLTIKCDTADVVVVSGYVNRISQGTS
jgi:hypothetical protein